MVKDRDVFVCPNFKLNDGTIHTTLFLILSGGDFWLPLICIKATSQTRRYQPLSSGGCYSIENRPYKCFFIPAEWKECFSKDTCLDLNQIYPIPLNDFLKLRDTNKLRPIGAVSKECFESILECICTQKEDIAEDIYIRLRETRDNIDNS